MLGDSNQGQSTWFSGPIRRCSPWRYGCASISGRPARKTFISLSYMLVVLCVSKGIVPTKPHQGPKSGLNLHFYRPVLPRGMGWSLFCVMIDSITRGEIPISERSFFELLFQLTFAGLNFSALDET